VVAQPLTTYCALYASVLADTGPRSTTLDDIDIQVLDCRRPDPAHHDPEFPSVHNCARFLGLAEILGYFDKARLVVNRANSGSDVAQLRTTLGIPVSGRVLSSGKLVVEAANQGTSVFALDPLRKDQFSSQGVLSR
jgi:hypothetical protein